MANSVKNKGLINSFKGELIENELYQSADNIIMVDRNNIYSHPIEHGSLWKQKQNLNRRKCNTIVLQIYKINWNANEQVERQF